MLNLPVRVRGARRLQRCGEHLALRDTKRLDENVLVLIVGERRATRRGHWKRQQLGDGTADLREARGRGFAGAVVKDEGGFVAKVDFPGAEVERL